MYYNKIHLCNTPLVCATYNALAIQFSKPVRNRFRRQNHTEQNTVPTEQPRRFNPPSQRYRYSEVVKRGGNSRRPVGRLPLKRSTEPIARTRDTSTIYASAKPPRRTNVDPIDNRYAAPIIGRGRSSKILAVHNKRHHRESASGSLRDEARNQNASRRRRSTCEPGNRTYCQM